MSDNADPWSVPRRIVKEKRAYGVVIPQIKVPVELRLCPDSKKGLKKLLPSIKKVQDSWGPELEAQISPSNSYPF